MENNVQMTLFQRVQLGMLWHTCRGFAKLPYWLRYSVIESIIFFVLYYGIRYRKKVVKENLRNSFPEKSKLELFLIRRKFYRTLAEMFVDTISLAGITDKQAQNLARYTHVKEHTALVKGSDWIAMMAHFGCWEYGPLWGIYDPQQVVVAVYHPLRSVVMDEFYQRLRKQHNAETVAMNEYIRFYLRHREHGLDGKNFAMGLIADQNPPLRPNSHWFRFLNQDTVFFDGGEKLALKCHLPVYFTYMKRIRRGCYEITFEQIYDGTEEVAENEITERYVRRLETMIQEHPELWMWSHRRWKHKRNEC
ncbi:MAG: lysophospholipid acyltransferase family protein [Alistipes sp.]